MYNHLHSSGMSASGMDVDVGLIYVCMYNTYIYTVYTYIYITNLHNSGMSASGMDVDVGLPIEAAIFNWF
jgi:hypothetical protein